VQGFREGRGGDCDSQRMGGAVTRGARWSWLLHNSPLFSVVLGEGLRGRHTVAVM
jgi:hypothetical protein